MDERPEAVSPPAPSRAIALIRRIAGPMWSRAGFTVVLTVRGRRTGTPHHVTLFPIEVEGTRYLLSQYGASDWVRNLRAAGRGELRRKGRTEAIAVVEVDSAERDRVIAAFHAQVPRLMSRDSDARPAAADHPTFRVDPIRKRTGRHTRPAP
jgi:deazaflavin-dependent oxidoreductase (nitroreductase family)